MTDYASWVERAQKFTASVATLPGKVEVKASVTPPLTNHEADELARRLPMGLPTVLRDFMTQGSSECDCRYSWEPPSRPWPKLKEIFTYENFIYGGPSICHAAELADLQESRLTWAECFAGDDDASRKDRELWTRCTPFGRIGNGDVLALDTTTGSNDPPVAYLCHDGGSSIISPAFTDFLRAWEAISYIGPEWWLLSYWTREDTGYIDSEHPKTELLRNLLTEPPAFGVHAQAAPPSAVAQHAPLTTTVKEPKTFADVVAMFSAEDPDYGKVNNRDPSSEFAFEFPTLPKVFDVAGMTLDEARAQLVARDDYDNPVLTVPLYLTSREGSFGFSDYRFQLARECGDAITPAEFAWHLAQLIAFDVFPKAVSYDIAFRPEHLKGARFYRFFYSTSNEDWSLILEDGEQGG